MVSSNFRKFFLLFWHKIRCIILNKKEKLFVKKDANHTISIYKKCMTSIFLMATTKYFQNNFKIALKIFFWFCLNRKLIFVLKKNCRQNLHFCVYKVVLDILIMDFFPFSLHNFFQKRLKLLFLLYGMFLYALINVW